MSTEIGLKFWPARCVACRATPASCRVARTPPNPSRSDTALIVLDIDADGSEAGAFHHAPCRRVICRRCCLSDPRSAMIGQRYPVTPDGRYFVVRGRLWRCSDPALPDGERKRLTSLLMAARRAVGKARRLGDAAGLAAAHEAVDAAKIGLGERGPVWWTDGAPDLNRKMARTSPYAAWSAAIEAGDPGPHAGALPQDQ